MKILLLSDTHSYIDERILQHVQNTDEVWHAGDIGDLIVTDKIKATKPLRAVYGNIDGTEARKEFPLYQIFMCEKVKVLMTHIGGYPGKYAKGIKDLLLREQPQIFISGHSHILKVQYDKQLRVLHLNPGAAGIYGHHQVRTMIRFEINHTDIKNMEIIELKKN
ncbi:MAG TPA: metallophosphoesterase family protein [Flavobacterium sp.]|nr:metallophosphoesterase family protein [Flavobacterium sp.]